MAPTEKQKCVAEQAIYGDLALNYCRYDEMEDKARIEQVYSRGVLDFLSYKALTNLNIILRPLSGLTKTITHNGYNEDKPFAPLVELLNLTDNGYDFLQFHSHDTESSIEYIINVDWGSGIEKCTYRFGYSHDLNRFYKLQFSPFRKPFGLPYQQQMFDLLHLWHFDTRNLITQGGAVDVNTLAKNPYEIETQYDINLIQI